MPRAHVDVPQAHEPIGDALLDVLAAQDEQELVSDAASRVVDRAFSGYGDGAVHDSERAIAVDYWKTQEDAARRDRERLARRAERLANPGRIRRIAQGLGTIAGRSTRPH